MSADHFPELTSSNNAIVNLAIDLKNPTSIVIVIVVVIMRADDIKC